MSNEQFAHLMNVQNTALRAPGLSLAERLAMLDATHLEIVEGLSHERYPTVQFERVPDEHLLDASDDTLSGSLADAGFGSAGPM